jgi:thioredoxin 1
LATENEGKAKVGKVNVADHMELAMQYGISAVPTILLFKGGEVVERMQGFKDKSELQEVLNTHGTSA